MLFSKPSAQGIFAGLVVFFAAGACQYALFETARRTMREAVDQDLLTVAQLAAQSLDAQEHAELRDPSQMNDADYARVVEPLRKTLHSLPRLKFIYTVRRSPEGPVFVVDAAEPGDADGDGVDDQGSLGEVYEDADVALLKTLEDGLPRVSAEPYTDAWGTFMTGFAPVLGAGGEIEAVVGVDSDASVYSDRVRSMAQAAIIGQSVATVISIGVGLGAFALQRARRKALESVLTRERELVAANAAVRAAGRAKDEFLSTMSHEIRTPMTAILGYTDMLADGHDLTELQRAETVATIQRSGAHLLSIINDILDFIQLDQEGVVIEAATCPIARTLREVSTSHAAAACEKGLSFELSVEGLGERVVMTNSARVKQVVDNLLSNAVKFTSRGSVSMRATISASPTGASELIISVVDSGIGVSADVRQRIFDPFTQADGSMSRHFGGTGLGLAISSRIVAKMNGTIRVESEPDKGTTFTVTLPVTVVNTALAGDREPGAVSAGESSHLRPLQGIRVLVAEDGPDNQRLIAMHLRKAGAEVVIVQDGQAAIEACHASGSEPFDLVLMDMMMPVLDGYSAAKQLKSESIRIPIVALTANALPNDRRRCLDAGCDDYFTKPLTRNSLVAVCLKWSGHTGVTEGSTN